MAIMHELVRLNDVTGYDPYNHIGRFMVPPLPKDPLKDKVLVMDTSALNLFKDHDIFREFLDSEMKKSFMIPSLLGTPVIRDDNLFGAIKTEDIT